MANNTKWTEELKSEMIDFFAEENKKGITSVNIISEKFAKKHKDLTPSQVRIAFYKFRDETMKNKDYHTGKWTEKENKDLLKIVKNRGKKTITSAFEEYQKISGRPLRNIAQHYYTITKTDIKDTKKEVRPKTETAIKLDNLPEDIIKNIHNLIISLNNHYTTQKV